MEAKKMEQDAEMEAKKMAAAAKKEKLQSEIAKATLELQEAQELQELQNQLEGMSLRHSFLKGALETLTRGSGSADLKKKKEAFAPQKSS